MMLIFFWWIKNMHHNQFGLIHKQMTLMIHFTATNSASFPKWMTLRIQSECHYALKMNVKIHSWSVHASTQTRGLNTQSLFLNFLPLFLPLCLPAKPHHQDDYRIVWETNWLCLWLGGEDNTGLRSQTRHSCIPPPPTQKRKTIHWACRCFASISDHL